MSPATRADVLKMGHATVDRILAAVRYGGELAARSRRRHAAELRRQIPVRTFTQWDEAKPGECSADLVAHCGQVLEGSFLWTLTVTDIVTGWTETVALMARDASTVVAALKVICTKMPMRMTALHADNGSEFINQVLLRYRRSEGLKFTRGRPYRKNDQCFVEQKNGHIVRRHVGFDRLEGIQACSVLNELYSVLRLHNNFFQPCIKLETKIRDGSKIVKRYEPARTPYQRVVAHAELDVENADALRALYLRLDPVGLLVRIRALQERLFALCVRAGHRDAVAAAMHVPQHIVTVHDDKPVTTYPDILPTGAAIINCSKRSTEGTRKYTKTARWHQARSQWRNHRDPFINVTQEFETILRDAPGLTGHALLKRLQSQFPNEGFGDGLIRTAQRRVQAWRAAYVIKTVRESDGEGQPASRLMAEAV